MMPSKVSTWILSLPQRIKTSLATIAQLDNIMNYQKAYEKALQEIKSWCPHWSEYDQKQEAEKMADAAYQQYSNFAS